MVKAWFHGIKVVCYKVKESPVHTYLLVAKAIFDKTKRCVYFYFVGEHRVYKIQTSFCLVSLKVIAAGFARLYVMLATQGFIILSKRIKIIIAFSFTLDFFW